MNNPAADQVTDKPRLLLVDDDETYCRVLKQALEKREFEVSVAYDVKNGIELAEQIVLHYQFL